MASQSQQRISRPIRIYLIDIQPIARVGLHSLFANQRSFSVVGEAPTLTAALPELWLSDPDVLITDVFPVPKSILDQHPTLRVLYTFGTLWHCSLTKLAQSLKQGLAGFILKDLSQNKFLVAVRQVAAGQNYRDPALMRLVRVEQQWRAKSDQVKAPSPERQELRPASNRVQKKSTIRTATSRHTLKRKK